MIFAIYEAKYVLSDPLFFAIVTLARKFKFMMKFPKIRTGGCGIHVLFQGIVTEVHLAPVLLATVLGRKLCAFDELSQLDPDLYKSLTYVKHYSDSDDVADLSLTFSIDEDVLGRLHTVDLVPGGRAIQVTNDNK